MKEEEEEEEKEEVINGGRCRLIAGALLFTGKNNSTMARSMAWNWLCTSLRGCWRYL